MIYFIQAPGGAIKIGYAENPRKRLQELQVGNAEPLKLIGTAPGDKEAEASHHRRFSSHVIRGEWFRPHPDILAAAAAHPMAPQPAARNIKPRQCEGLNKALRCLGVDGVAKVCGIRPPSVSGWKRIPAERVAQISAASGLAKHVLRADLYDAPDEGRAA